MGLVPSTSMVASNLMDIGLLCSEEPELEAEADAAEGGANRPPTVVAIIEAVDKVDGVDYQVQATNLLPMLR